ncbi:MAG: nitronate monooxygenase [Bacillus subtilis]|nr:nitronate monooxygenase [Bacillus subtilis]
MTDKPFGVNIMLMSPHAAAIAEMVAEERVAGRHDSAPAIPASYIPMPGKQAGIKVIPVVPSVGSRPSAWNAPAPTPLIAEGTESGGHIGELTTMAMIPQIVDAVKIPVIAAGGIADHRQVLAAFALGAKGVQCGTVLSRERRSADPRRSTKQEILAAKDIDTIVTGRQTGAPVRVLKNAMARRIHLDCPTKAFPSNNWKR